MKQDDFFRDIKSTWQSVDIPHKSLLKKARRNSMFYWIGVAYSVLASLVSIVAGVWFISQNASDVIHWLGGLTLIFIVPGLAYFSTKDSWSYIKWDDKSAEGTLSQLIKQCEISIRLHQLARYVGLTYIAVPLIGIATYYLGLTQVPLTMILAFSLGLLTSTVAIVIWAQYRIRRKRNQLTNLRQMHDDLQHK